MNNNNDECKPDELQSAVIQDLQPQRNTCWGSRCFTPIYRANVAKAGIAGMFAALKNAQ